MSIKTNAPVSPQIQSAIDALPKVYSMYDAVVGSSGQVSSGIATHTTIQAAHDAISSGGSILILSGVNSGTLTVSKSGLSIQGQGVCSINTTILSSSALNCRFTNITFVGTVTLQASSSSNFFTGVNFLSNVSVASGAIYNKFISFYISLPSTITDSNSPTTVNLYLGIE